MKRVYLIMLFLLTNMMLFSQYYWSRGQQIPIKEGDKRYVLFSSQKENNLDCYQKTGKTDNPAVMWGIQDTSFAVSNDAIYYSPSYVVENDSSDVYITEKFYVKLKDSNDYSVLEDFAKAYNVNIIKPASVPLWYILACTNTKRHSLQMANIFYESQLFAAAQPEFINVYKLSCPNDTYFHKQWNLKNTGQHGASYSGIDINYCDAHTLTSGSSSVIIAVLDIGVELSHEDLNIYNVSYDTSTGTSPSLVYGAHGTACAGIIGAKTNNNLGVAGIAPNCPVMSISNSFGFYSTASQMADGFIFAANNGASVISNSWHLTVSDDQITDAIEYALTYGRNGKGCVVVFAVGNDNSSTVSYPANSIDDIITVGAISPDGKRKQIYAFDGEFWGSNYGNKLDVMAPGVLIPTTDRTGTSGYSNTVDTLNYYMRFNGTSAACPHVAAVAGLMLSVNPNLTQKKVAKLIEKTAQKVGGYTYSQHSGRPNGTWNDSVGYGLVDAYEAVWAAYDMKINGLERLCNTNSYSLANCPSMGVVIWTYETNIQQVDTFPIIRLSNIMGTSVTVQRGTYRPYANGPQYLYSGYVTLKAHVIYSGFSKTYSKTLLMHDDGKPTLPSSSLSQIGWQETRTFTISNFTDVPDNMLKWVITMPQATSTITHYGHSWTVTPTTPGTLNIKLYNLENCSTALHSNYNIVVNFLIPVEPPLLSHPNPVTTSSVDIHITNNNNKENSGGEDSEHSPSTIYYTLELWDDQSRALKSINGELSGEEDIVTLDISGLNNGIYLLTLKVDNQIVRTSKMIINH